MSKNLSEAQILEVINNSDGSYKVVKSNGITLDYKVNPPLYYYTPQVGVKRKYPFDNNQENQRNGVKKFRSN